MPGALVASLLVAPSSDAMAEVPVQDELQFAIICTCCLGDISLALSRTTAFASRLSDQRFEGYDMSSESLLGANGTEVVPSDVGIGGIDQGQPRSIYSTQRSDESRDAWSVFDAFSGGLNTPPRRASLASASQDRSNPCGAPGRRPWRSGSADWFPRTPPSRGHGVGVSAARTSTKRSGGSAATRAGIGTWREGNMMGRDRQGWLDGEDERVGRG